jgi:hypothetical protein
MTWCMAYLSWYLTSITSLGHYLENVNHILLVNKNCQWVDAVYDSTNIYIYLLFLVKKIIYLSEILKNQR